MNCAAGNATHYADCLISSPSTALEKLIAPRSRKGRTRNCRSSCRFLIDFFDLSLVYRDADNNGRKIPLCLVSSRSNVCIRPKTVFSYFSFPLSWRFPKKLKDGVDRASPLPRNTSINRYHPLSSFLRSVPRWRSHCRAKRSDIQSRGIVYSWPARRT